MSARLTGLFVHPIKSCGAIALERVALEPRGLRHDRRWAIVAPDGRALTQRDEPRLALVKPRLEGERLVVEVPQGAPFVLEPAPERGRRAASVWGARVEALHATALADERIAAFLGREAAFVHMDAAARRPVGGDAPPGDPTAEPAAERAGEVSFADELPLLVVGEASLAALNARLERPVPMDRFRPNLVVGGSEPFEEDGWRRVAIGGVPIELVKPAGRCVVVTIDQRSARRAEDREPLATLARFRRRTARGPGEGNLVYFGVRATPATRGELAVGDPLEVLERC